jgi:hypothetical protein
MATLPIVLPAETDNGHGTCGYLTVGSAGECLAMTSPSLARLSHQAASRAPISSQELGRRSGREERALAAPGEIRRCLRPFAPQGPGKGGHAEAGRHMRNRRDGTFERGRDLPIRGRPSDTMGSNPMTTQMGYMGEAAPEPNKALVLTLAESCLRPADLLDTVIRRLVIAVIAKDSRSEPRMDPRAAG